MSKEPQDRPRYLAEHLSELRRALIRSMIAVAVGVGAAFWKSSWLFDFLLKPFNTVRARIPEFGAQIHSLQTLSPIEAFLIDMKLATAAGLVLASPFVLREAWAYTQPALKPSERSGVLLAFFLGLFFFTAGLAFGYYVIVPLALEFLIRYNLDYHFLPQWTLQEYFDFTVNFLLVFGCVFELPMVLAALVSIGVATPEFLAYKRKYAIFGIFLLAALIAPSADPLTQTLVAVPLVFLYEVGILLSRLAVRRKKMAGEAGGE